MRLILWKELTNECVCCDGRKQKRPWDQHNNVTIEIVEIIMANGTETRRRSSFCGAGNFQFNSFQCVCSGSRLNGDQKGSGTEADSLWSTGKCGFNGKE